MANNKKAIATQDYVNTKVSEKIDANQGTENAGKVLGTNASVK